MSNNVIKSLEFMSQNSGNWYGVTIAGVWYHNLNDERATSSEGVGFTQDDLREFLADYNRMKAANAAMENQHD
jgi:hypothetical protein